MRFTASLNRLTTLSGRYGPGAATWACHGQACPGGAILSLVGLGLARVGLARPWRGRPGPGRARSPWQGQNCHFRARWLWWGQLAPGRPARPGGAMRAWWGLEASAKAAQADPVPPPHAHPSTAPPPVDSPGLPFAVLRVAALSLLQPPVAADAATGCASLPAFSRARFAIAVMPLL